MAETEFKDAIALLKADHRKVEELFTKFENTNGKATKRKLAEQICNELKVHTLLEEEIFYPAFQGKIEEDTLAEAFVEPSELALVAYYDNPWLTLDRVLRNFAAVSPRSVPSTTVPSASIT